MNNHPRKILGIIMGLVFLILFIMFGLDRFGRIITGPQIIAINLQEYSTIQENPIFIEGSLINTSILRINGVHTPINDDLKFRNIIVIPTGNSIIEIDIYDTFDNHRQYQYHVSYIGEEREYPSTLRAAQNNQVNVNNEENLEEQEQEQEQEQEIL